MVDIKQLKATFIEKFGGDEHAVRLFFAPGRVNIIGEHIDYNGGQVLPCALDFGTYAAVRKREDGKVRFASMNMPLANEISLDDVVFEASDDWMNYPKGVIRMIQDMGHNVGGFDVLYEGNIPRGSGLSSSASVEVLTGVIVNELFQLGIDMMDIVKISQKAENDFVGMNCGIMDQFAVGMGKEGQAILLNCDTLEYRYSPLDLGDCKIVIANTRTPRSLTDSKYNERRAECDRAVLNLQKKLDITYLCEMSPEVFEANKMLIENPVDRKRAAHAVYEQDRVVKAFAAMESGDMIMLGQYLDASHDSLRDLYEVTGEGLDTMVNEARKIDGVLGSRMTGAGFGGCTISLVKAEAIDRFIEQVGKAYQAHMNIEGEFYIATVGDGAKELVW